MHGLASGGIVTRPTRALIGESGPEAVIPLDRMSGGGEVHVHFHAPVIGTGLSQAARELVGPLRMELARTGRRNVSVISGLGIEA